MSGRPSHRQPLSAHGALSRLALMSLVAWGMLIAASVAEHRRDGQWGPTAQLVAAAPRS